MKQYVEAAMVEYKISEAEAKADFMNRWARASDGGEYSDLLPKMSDDERRKSRFINVTTALQKDTKLNNFDDKYAYGLNRGEGKVTVGDKTAKISKKDVLVISPDGQIGTIPAEQLQDAINEGYQLAK